MRRLVACCDGTWKTYADDTNVARLHRHLAETDAQVVRYFPGSPASPSTRTSAVTWTSPSAATSTPSRTMRGPVTAAMTGL